MLLDFSLRDTCGVELHRQIHASHPDLPVLALSMHDESVYAERALRAGAKDYVTKAQDPESLIAAITVVSRGETVASETIRARLLQQILGRHTGSFATAIERLSDRELEVLEFLGRGLGTRQVAEQMV